MCVCVCGCVCGQKVDARGEEQHWQVRKCGVLARCEPLIAILLSASFFLSFFYTFFFFVLHPVFSSLFPPPCLVCLCLNTCLGLYVCVSECVCGGAGGGKGEGHTHTYTRAHARLP